MLKMKYLASQTLAWRQKFSLKFFSANGGNNDIIAIITRLRRTLSRHGMPLAR